MIAYIYFDRKAQAVDDAKAEKYQQMKASSSGAGAGNADTLDEKAR